MGVLFHSIPKSYFCNCYNHIISKFNKPFANKHELAESGNQNQIGTKPLQIAITKTGDILRPFDVYRKSPILHSELEIENAFFLCPLAKY